MQAKLAEELPGILAWMVKGCLEWQGFGLAVPGKVKRATASYRQEMDRLDPFLEDRCLIDPEATMALGDAYSEYRRWADDACQDAVSKRSFGDLMRQRGFTKDRDNKKRFLKGIRLLTDAEKADGVTQVT